MSIKYIRISLFIVLFFSVIPIVNAQKKTRVEILNMNYFRSDDKIGNGAKRLIGNVIFKQDSTIMTCDSAWFYSKQNMFEAYSNVHLYKEGDETIDVKSEFLRHNGNTKMAQFRKNVVLRDTQVVLYTDSLDYNIQSDIGYYLYGAEIVDSATTLKSKKGYYYHDKQQIFFKKNVEVIHNDGEYELYTDTLKYNTNSKVTYFFGPTELYNDTNYMYADFGWYNTENDKAFFKQNSLYSNPKQTIEADSLFYDRDNEHGIAYSNVVATDTSENVIIKGNLLEVFKNPEQVIVTDSALLIHVIDNDSLYLHADTIITEFDTSGDHRVFKAYHHARIYKSNFQVQTDSLFFSMVDSILQFHGSPVLWAEQNQITASYIEAFVIDNKLDRFHLYKGGLIISKEDTSHFNQVKGVEMIGYLRKNSLHKIDVFKKSETIYFPVDEYGILGANKSQSGNITILLRNNKISRIIYRQAYTGKMQPLEELTPKETRVRGFVWLENQRPLVPLDVFRWESNWIKELKLHRSNQTQQRSNQSNELDK